MSKEDIPQPVPKETSKKEVWVNNLDSKKPPQKTEKPWDGLEEIRKKVQKTYEIYSDHRKKLSAWEDEQKKDKSPEDPYKGKAEEQLKAEEEAFKKEEKTYQTITYDTTLAKKEKANLEEQKIIEWKWLAKSVTDLHYDIEPLDESRVQFLAKTFPEAWKNAIVDPNIDLRSNTELAVVRERILGELRTTEKKIFENSSWRSEEEVIKELAENFQKVTGIPTNQEAFKKYVLEQSKQVDSSPVDKRWNDTSSKTFGPSATRGFSAGWSADVPSASNGAENIPPVEASKMTKATYQWQWSWFKMRWPLKDVSPSDRSPTLLAQLAKQGTNPGWSTGTCYKSVKNHLCAAWYVDSSYKMIEWSAQNAGNDLSRIQFKEIIPHPTAKNAVEGDVLVYSGWQHGHIEIKTGDGYASDFFSNNPSGRQLIGVWRPPTWGAVWPQNIAWTDKDTKNA